MGVAHAFEPRGSSVSPSIYDMDLTLDWPMLMCEVEQWGQVEEKFVSKSILIGNANFPLRW